MQDIVRREHVSEECTWIVTRRRALFEDVLANVSAVITRLSRGRGACTESEHGNDSPQEVSG